MWEETKADIDADADDADEAGSAAAVTARPTSSDPTVNAYIAQLGKNLLISWLRAWKPAA